MKLETPEVFVETNMPNDDINFSLDSESYVIFDILRNKIYSDPIGAVVRETCSNARDANHETGNEDKPIKIWITDNAFIVEDNGPGISEWRMENICSQYGKSTKTNSDNLIGCFGLGMKSFFAVTDSATFETNVDGTKYLYLFYLDKTNKGGIKLLNKELTKDDNGTKVKIPITKEQKTEFKENVFLVTKYWQVPPIIVGEPKIEAKNPVINGTKWAIYKNDVIDGYNILYGDLPYQDTQSGIPHGIVLKFPIGALSLTASRENLLYNEKTKVAIEDAISNFKLEIVDHVNTQIDNADKFEDVIKVIHAIPNWLDKKEYIWRGYKFTYPLNDKIPYFERKHNGNLQLNWTTNLNPYGYGIAKREFSDSQIIILDKDDWNSYDRQRVSYWMREYSINRIYLIRLAELPISGANLSEIKVKRNMTPKNAKTAKTHIHCKILGDRRKRSFPIDTTTPIIYTINGVSPPYNWRNLVDIIADITEKDQKLIANQKNWMQFDEYVDREFSNKLTEQEIQHIADNIKNSNSWYKLSFLAKTFDEFKPTLMDAKIDEKTRKYIEYLIASGKVIPKTYEYYKKYPLLEATGWLNQNHYPAAIEYVKLIKKEKGEKV